MTRRAVQFEPPYWYASAPCASVDPNLWFPPPDGMGYDAKRVCGTCPYKAPCLAGALERDEPCGIWGGVAARQFPRLRRELAREAS